MILGLRKLASSGDVHQLSNLPLLKRLITLSRRPRINFIVFVVDLASRLGWIQFQTMMHESIHTDYLGGRCALVLSKAGSSSCATMIEEVEAFAADYEVPVLYSELEGPDLDIVRRRLMQLIKIASGHVKGVSSATALSVNFELCHNSSLE